LPVATRVDANQILQQNIAIGDERVVELFWREAKLAGRPTYRCGKRLTRIRRLREQRCGNMSLRLSG
jgi:hypothetical protein